MKVKGSIKAKNESGDWVKIPIVATGNQPYDDKPIKDKIDKVEKEINEYNISSIKGAEYANLQSAVNALNTYLTDDLKKAGVKVTFVSSVHHKAETWMYQGGGFVSVASWTNEPLGGYQRALFEADGATLNEKDGYWYLNGVKLTEDEMALVHNVGRPKLVKLSNSSYVVDSLFAGFNGKTNVPNINYTTTWFTYLAVDGLTLSNLFNGDSKIEALNLFGENTVIRVKTLNDTFNSASALKRVFGILDVTACVEQYDMITPFRECVSLVDVKLKGLKQSVPFSSSQSLSVEDNEESTLGYIVANAKNDKPITITLHHDAYVRVSQSLIEKAKAKQISFADASAS